MSTKAKLGVFIVNNQDQLLLIKEKIKKNPEPRWNIIKGSYGDNGIETIFDTARRECQEEVSVKVELKKSLGCYIAQKEDDIRIQFNLLAEIIEGEPKISDTEEQKNYDENITELKWFTKEELKSLNKDEFISNRIFVMINDWIEGGEYPLEIFKTVEM
ncbi:NUDIX hydrolase [Candidatus Falkowbacteria bacterium]|uniref:Nudix hydrolase domain-containing protein n=1 Tax=Candidatus Buchananbacteria bacterium CG10_big_fil_rev_8_21_14_0_10_33_19 TaxID=1974525 RepID=A0A2H0W4Z8_9BACT|nr:NUDIX hydrolase [Candidatus Falkowbacteria bacterium]PIS06432.1 MAG: hypothetical protein COT80_00625 [Candidatus Buchananbacteria bacterium CG10_big_fil_rev_8_21_14_0_10_33_19]